MCSAVHTIVLDASVMFHLLHLIDTPSHSTDMLRIDQSAVRGKDTAARNCVISIDFCADYFYTRDV
jgi:hypothetical protein